LLQRSPVIVPIPGTLRVWDLEENVAAAGLSLGPSWSRYPPQNDQGDAVDVRDSLTKHEITSASPSFYASAARIAAWGRFRNDGAPARNHGAIMLSKIMQPNAELGMNGQMGLPHR